MIFGRTTLPWPGSASIFPLVPIAAFTATATRRVQGDIIAKLGLCSPFVPPASFDRPNLFYEVIAKADARLQILSFVDRRRGQPGIVYRLSRKSVEQTDGSRANGIRSLPYHAGLDDGTRTRNQDAFRRDRAEVVVATIAFGMGIDKSNVRYVVHGDLPKNIESYYQETGRAGRDGEPAHCLLLYSPGDIPRLASFINKLPDAGERRRLRAVLDQMASVRPTDDVPPPQASRLFRARAFAGKLRRLRQLRHVDARG